MEEVAEGIHVVSVPLPEGFSANVMVVLDEEPGVLDCGPPRCAFDLLDRIEAIVPWEEVLFLGVVSARPEHLSGIEKFLAALPNVRVLALDRPEMRERLRVLAVGRPVWFVEDGSSVPLGRRGLKFVHLPLPGAPETAGVLVEPEGVLYSGDLGASFDPFEATDASDEGLERATAELLAGEGDEAMLERAVERALSLRPSVLVPGHGPVCKALPERRLERWLEAARRASAKLAERAPSGEEQG